MDSEAATYLTNAILGVVFCVVATRLFRLARRSGEAPERFMSLAFGFWGLSYLIWAASGFGLPEGREWLLNPAIFLANSFALVADVSFAVFIRVVFREQEAWAGWLVLADCVLLIVGVAGSHSVGDPNLYLPASNPFYYCYFLGATLPLAWMMYEGFSQYNKARRRVRLSLCAPSVCNRYLLISLASSLWILYYALLHATNLSFQQTQVWSSGLNSAMVATEIAAVVTFWFVFLPPRVYRRWLDDDRLSTTACSS